jgi:hypothetical protein
MKKFIFLLNFILLVSGISSAQDTLRVEGRYTGRNIYVQNPFNGSGKEFCTKKVLVNKIEIGFEQASAFEINLAALDFPVGTTMKIEIIYSSSCLPKILNTEMHCLPQCMYSIFSIEIKNDTMLTWTSAETNGKFYYTIEQFRWNKWVKCGEVASTSGSDTIAYSFNVKKHLHSGENQFRVKVLDYSPTPVYSAVAKQMQPEIRSNMSKCNGDITFGRETFWEVYDSEGNMIRSGYGNFLSINSFPHGHYYLNYDNTTAEFYRN